MQEFPTHQLTQFNLKDKGFSSQKNNKSKNNKEEEHSQSQPDDTLKVPPVIADDKQQYLIKEILYTLSGFPSHTQSLFLNFTFAFLFTAIIIIPPIVIGTLDPMQAQSLLLVAILISTFLPSIILFLADVIKYGCAQLLNKNPQKYIIFMVYGLLWSNHFFMLTRYQNIVLLVLSFISIITSINTVTIDGVKQFYGTSPQYSKLSLDSTRFVRFFVVFPTLLGQFIIDRIAFMNTIENQVWILRLVSSIIFALWFLGWISSLRNTLLMVINILNHIFGGDEKKNDVWVGLVALILNLVPWGLYCILILDLTYGHLMLIGGASLTSIVTFLFTFWLYPSYTLAKSGWLKIVIKIIIELIICIALLIITALANLTSVGVFILSIIDVVVFLILLLIEDISRGRSHFGFQIKPLANLLGGSNIFLITKRLILRVTMSLTMIGITQELLRLPCQFKKYIGYQQCPNLISYTIGWNQNTILYFVIPILVYRCFKRSISEPTNWSFHIAIFISLIVRIVRSPLDDYSYGIFIVLLWPPFPSNFYMTLISPFIIPKKFRRPNENFCVKVLYILVTLIGVILYTATFGVLQLTILFGLPIFWCVIPSTTQGNQIKTSQQSLYLKILKNLQYQIFQGRKKGFYLLRVQKYIMTVQIKSQNYGICQVLQFKGMQAQEVTSCHSRQGQTIDLQVQQTWRDNEGENQNCCRLASPYSTVLWPQSKYPVAIPLQNDIKLTGIIQTKEFLSLFKTAVMKSFIYYLSKTEMCTEQKQEAEVIHSQIGAIINKQSTQNKTPFDFDFAKQVKLSVAAPSNQSSPKKKLPPLITAKKGGNSVANDFIDLIDQSKGKEENKTSQIQMNLMKNAAVFIPIKVQQLNFALVFTFYYYSVGKQNYVNLNKVYRIIAKDSDAMTQINFKNKQQFASKAIGSAFKICVSKFLEADLNVTLQDFQNYQKNEYLGTIQSQGFRQAVKQNKQDIWSISYIKRQISIKRLAKSDAQLYIFSIDEVIVKSVWNNLRFQLLFAANNDDERYSIQTHGKLLRNLWIQACQEPFGYAGYYSGNTMNY